MKTTILTALTLLLQFESIGQEDKALTGKWKIITVDAMVYHDYRNDSTYYPPEFLETLKGSKDSSFMIGFLDGIVKGFSNYYYIFKDNKEYQEVKAGKVKEHGSYEVDKKTRQMNLMTKDKFGGETKQNLQYELTGETLLLKIPSEEMPIKMQLIKTE